MTIETRATKRPRPTWDVVPSPRPPQARREVAAGGDCRLAVAETGLARASPPLREDDRDGHYVFNIGENSTPRYKILSQIGEGTFGRVLECWDRETREYVAVKVVRSIRKYREAAMLEIDVPNQVAETEKGGLWYATFKPRTTFCADKKLVRLSQSHVYYMHDMHLIHTDLKPENILLISSEYVKLLYKKRISQGEMHFKYLPKSSAIKLIDFGSTTFENEGHSSVVSTRHYRAPEVILGKLVILMGKVKNQVFFIWVRWNECLPMHLRRSRTN